MEEVAYLATLERPELSKRPIAGGSACNSQRSASARVVGIRQGRSQQST